MAEDRNIEVVIKAKDEFSETMERAAAASEDAASRIRSSLEEASPDKSTAEVESYGTALEQTIELESKWAEAKAKNETAREPERVEEASPYKTPEPEEKDSEADGLFAAYQNKLTLLQSYNTQVIEEMIRAGAAQADIEAAYTELSLSYAEKRRDFQVSAAGEPFGSVSGMMQNLSASTDSSHRSIFETMKAFSIAETAIKTYQGAMEASSALAGIPIVGPALGAAAAAAVMAAGAARVANIKATSPGGATSISSSGTGSPSYEGSTTEAYPVTTTLDEGSSSTQSVTVNIYNPLSEQNWAEIVENDIIPALNDASDRNIEVKVNVMES